MISSDVTTAPVPQDDVPWRESSILTPEQYLHFAPNVEYGASATPVSDGQYGKAAFLERTSRAYGRELTEIVDPRRCWGHASAKHPMWYNVDVRLKYFRDDLPREVDGYRMQVEELSTASETRYRTTYVGRQDKDVLLHVLVHSSLDGFNIRSEEAILAATGRVVQRRQKQYKRQQEVYVPVQMSVENFSSTDAAPEYSRKLTFTSQSINEEIPPDTFTYRNLGLKDGDRLIDSIQSISYTFVGGKLVPAAGAPSRPGEKDAPAARKTPPPEPQSR